MNAVIKNLNAFYGKKQILHNISFEIQSGSFTALIGRNGCGKTTLAACLGSGLKYSGDITVGGVNLNTLKPIEKAKLVSVMPQLLNTPHITVDELVTFGRSPYLSPAAHLSQADRQTINKAIAAAGLEEIRGCFLDRISGGELRRAYLGMILAQDTPVIVLDEATAYMDADNEAKFLSLITKLKTEQNKTVVCIMHSLANAVKYADSIAVMDKGKIIFSGKTSEILQTDIIEKNFGVERFEAENRIFFA